jgi:chromosome segregation ATPase
MEGKNITNEELAKSIEDLSIVLKESFDAVGIKFQKIDDKFDKIDERFDRIDERFDNVESELSYIKVEIKTIKDRLDKLSDRVFEGETTNGSDILDLRKRVEFLENKVKELSHA